MLIEFSVKNFMSIKDEITFNMFKGEEFEKIDEQCLKVGAIYGANASGKTNFVKAISTAIMMIRKSNSRNVSEKLVQMIPFKFDEETMKKPCEFKFTFLKNNIKYVYSFSADIDKVYTESLYCYISEKANMIFERHNTKEYKFMKEEYSKLQEIASKNAANKLFFASLAVSNYERAKDAFMWFAEDINTFYDYKDLAAYAFYNFEKDNSQSLKDFTLKLLEQADKSIKDYILEFENVDTNNKDKKVLQKKIRVLIVHEFEKEEGKKESYKINLQQESLGTQNIFFLSPILKEILEKGKTVVVDEFDKTMHPLLAKYIISLFNDEEINKNIAQLIFNIHEKHILSTDIVKKEQIWCAEKNFKNGSTYLCLADD